jgi:hypothetical protein
MYVNRMGAASNTPQAANDFAQMNQSVGRQDTMVRWDLSAS